MSKNKLVMLFASLLSVSMLFGCSINIESSVSPETTTTREESKDESKEEIANNKGNDCHSEITKITDYLFEVSYNSYEENLDLAKEYLLKYKPQLGGCSSVQYGSIRGRNYDWTFDEAPEFVVRIPATENRHASIGIATTTAITADQVEAGEELDMYKYLPYFTLDGINDAGVTININVVNFGEKGEFVMKTEDESDDICPLMVSRLVLDNAGSIDEALALIEEMDIFSLGTVEESHFMISGPQSATDDTLNTVVVEFIPDENKHLQLSVIDNAKGDFVDNKMIMTNFHLTGFDGSIESLTSHPMGYERYLILSDAYEQGSTIAGMKDLMKKVYYSNAYDPYSNMVWYSEFAEGDLTMLNRGESKINGDCSKAGAYADVLKSEYEAYIDRNMNRNVEEKGWHTVHTSVYNIENKTLSVLPQEAGFSYDFSLE